jgi:hypothetical protein
MPPLLRPSADADLAAIAAIYGHAVVQGTASLELEPPSQAEMARRRAAILEGGFPYLVAEIVGWGSFQVEASRGLRARRGRPGTTAGRRVRPGAPYSTSFSRFSSTSSTRRRSPPRLSTRPEDATTA